MAAELRRLRSMGVVLTSLDRNYLPEPSEMQRALNYKLRIPLHNIAVSKHRHEDLLARFDHPDQAEQAVRHGIIEVGGTQFLIQPWREEVYSRPADWYFHCKIVIERLPLFAWCEDGVRQAIGDVCSFDYIEPISFTQENTEVLQCWVWMCHPDQLPRSKVTTVFSEGAGRSRPGVTAAPPGGGMTNLIIHLDSFFDWSPPPASTTPSSRVSSHPSSSTSEHDGRSFPFFQSFTWFPGVLDGRTPSAAAPRMRNTSKGPHRDHEEDNDDARRGPRRQWPDSGNGRGKNVAHASRDGPSFVDRYRSRSPVQHGRRHGDYETYTMESRGRSKTRDPPSPTRLCDLAVALRDDEGWGRRRSRSPQRYRTVPADLLGSGGEEGCHPGHAMARRAARSSVLPEDGQPMATGVMLTHEQDPFIDYLTSLCQDSTQHEKTHLGYEQDPVLLEVAAELQRQMTYSTATSLPTEESGSAKEIRPVSLLRADAALAFDSIRRRSGACPLSLHAVLVKRGGGEGEGEAEGEDRECRAAADGESEQNAALPPTEEPRARHRDAEPEPRRAAPRHRRRPCAKTPRRPSTPPRARCSPLPLRRRLVLHRDGPLATTPSPSRRRRTEGRHRHNRADRQRPHHNVAESLAGDVLVSPEKDQGRRRRELSAIHEPLPPRRPEAQPDTDAHAKNATDDAVTAVQTNPLPSRRRTRRQRRTSQAPSRLS